MLRRRVPALRLGSKGPGGDEKSLPYYVSVQRPRRKASASVATGLDARRVHPRKCPGFWALLSSSINRVNNHREGGNCARFLSFLSLSRAKRVNGHREGGLGGLGVAFLVTVVAFGPSCRVKHVLGGGGKESRKMRS